jgi:hypothetical protein
LELLEVVRAVGLDHKALVWAVAHELCTVQVVVGWREQPGQVVVGWREQLGLQKQPGLRVAVSLRMRSAMVLTETVHSAAY